MITKIFSLSNNMDGLNLKVSKNISNTYTFQPKQSIICLDYNHCVNSKPPHPCPSPFMRGIPLVVPRPYVPTPPSPGRRGTEKQPEPVSRQPYSPERRGKPLMVIPGNAL